MKTELAEIRVYLSGGVVGKNVHVCGTEKATKRLRGEVKSLLLSCFYLFIPPPLGTVIFRHCTVTAFSGAGSVISLEGGWAILKAPAALKGAAWRRGRSLLGDPSRGFSDETETELVAPQSHFPQWLEESAFSSAAITFCHTRTHTCTYTHTITFPLTHPFTGNLLTLQQETKFK